MWWSASERCRLLLPLLLRVLDSAALPTALPCSPSATPQRQAADAAAALAEADARCQQALDALGVERSRLVELQAAADAQAAQRAAAEERCAQAERTLAAEKQRLQDLQVRLARPGCWLLAAGCWLLALLVRPARRLPACLQELQVRLRPPGCAPIAPWLPRGPGCWAGLRCRLPAARDGVPVAPLRGGLW